MDESGGMLSPTRSGHLGTMEGTYKNGWISFLLANSPSFLCLLCLFSSVEPSEKNLTTFKEKEP